MSCSPVVQRLPKEVILQLGPELKSKLKVSSQGLHSALRTSTMRVRRGEKDTPKRTC